MARQVSTRLFCFRQVAVITAFPHSGIGTLADPPGTSQLVVFLSSLALPSASQGCTLQPASGSWRRSSLPDCLRCGNCKHDGGILAAQPYLESPVFKQDHGGQQLRSTAESNYLESDCESSCSDESVCLTLSANTAPEAEKMPSTGQIRP